MTKDLEREKEEVRDREMHIRQLQAGTDTRRKRIQELEQQLQNLKEGKLL